jgi:polar amino acid transport system substrate-binding protein
MDRKKSRRAIPDLELLNPCPLIPKILLISVENMTYAKLAFILLSFLLLTIPPNAEEIQATSSMLPEDAALQKLVVAISNDTVPFHYVDEEGQPSGIIIDLWRLWSKKTGIEVEFKNAPWSETLAMVKDGRADVHAGLNFNEERDAFLDFGSSLVSSSSFIFYHKNLYGLYSIDDLSPFRVGVLQESHEATILKPRLPHGALIEYANLHSLYEAVKVGDIRVFADIEQTAQHFLDQRDIGQEVRYDNSIFSTKETSARNSGTTKAILWIEMPSILLCARAIRNWR